MASSSTGQWRRLWFNIHLWIGVALTVLLAPLGVTGSILVWRQELNQPPGVTGAGLLAPSAYLAAAGLEAPGARPVSMRLPDHDGGAVSVSVRPAGGGEGSGREGGGRRRQTTLWFDPPTARLLRTVPPGGGWLGAVHDLHETLMIEGGFGAQLVGWCGWALLASSVTGLWLWWPRVGGLGAAFRWRRTGFRLLNLHHVVGFWICLPLAVLSLTGAALAFPRLTAAVIGAPAPREDGARLRAAHAGVGSSGAPSPAEAIDRVTAEARAAIPAARLVGLTLPAPGAAAWRASLRGAGGEPLTATVDGLTGVVKAGPSPAPGDSARRWLHRLHGGEQTSLFWRLWITLAGLAPTLLGVTGIVVWLRRRTLSKA